MRHIERERFYRCAVIFFFFPDAHRRARARPQHSEKFTRRFTDVDY